MQAGGAGGQLGFVHYWKKQVDSSPAVSSPALRTGDVSRFLNFSQHVGDDREDLSPVDEMKGRKFGRVLSLSAPTQPLGDVVLAGPFFTNNVLSREQIEHFLREERKNFERYQQRKAICEKWMPFLRVLEKISRSLKENVITDDYFYMKESVSDEKGDEKAGDDKDGTKNVEESREGEEKDVQGPAHPREIWRERLAMDNDISISLEDNMSAPLRPLPFGDEDEDEWPPLPPEEIGISVDMIVSLSKYCGEELQLDTIQQSFDEVHIPTSENEQLRIDHIPVCKLAALIAFVRFALLCYTSSLNGSCTSTKQAAGEFYL